MKVERLQERLKQREFKLDTLLDITTAINANMSATELAEKFREVVENRLLISRATFLIRHNEMWECLLSFGSDNLLDHIDVKMDLGQFRTIGTIQASTNPVLKQYDLVIPVLQDERHLAYLLIGDIDDDEIRVSPIIKHLHFIQTLTNIIAVAIENRELFRKSLEQERIRTELTLAAEMQELMVGSGRKEYGHFEVASYYKPHQQVGGDFYDFIPLNENDAFFCMADVSGKGVSAAFLMSNIQAHMKAFLQFTDWDLDRLARELNRKVVETVRGERFVTMFMGHYQGDTHTLQFINAGHTPPALYTDGQVILLDEGTVGIGMLDELPFVNIGTKVLKPDSIVVCYTDGVVEMENESEEEFGYERLSDLLLEKAESTEHVDDLISEIIHAIDLHRGTNPYSDDTALLCCRFR